MQRLSGVLLILAGAALGAYSYLPAPQNGAEKLAEVTRISAAPDRVITSSISPSVTTPAIAEPARNGDGTRVFSNATPLAPIASEASSAETARAPASAWSTVVTTEPAAQMQKLTSPKPGDAQTRTVLTSDLQRELKRVGCYAGEINGAWTPSTQRAMSAFMERVNATLPTAEPDYILLTLVQGHTATACGAECPSGEVMTAGRCVPQAVVAQATRKSQRAEERRVAELHKVQQQELLAQEQRTAEAQKIAEKSKLANAAVAERSETARKVADAAKVAAAMKRADARKAAEALSQAVASVEPEKLPWLADDAAAAKGAAAPSTRGEPPPGMMSLSGPRTSEPQLPANAAAVTPDRGPRPVTSGETSDTSANANDTAPIIAPAPQKAVRPAVQQAALPQQGLPGTKAGPAARSAKLATAKAQTKYRSAKIVRRPPPVIAYAAPRPRPYAYASNYSSKGAPRNQPRPGTARFNLMQSLGGIY